MGKKRRRQRGAPSTQPRSGGRSPQTDLTTAETANPQRNLARGRDLGPVDLLLLQRTVGNQAVARLVAVWTRGVTIASPRAQVWPWLAQLGAGRAGWYS